LGERFVRRCNWLKREDALPVTTVSLERILADVRSDVEDERDAAPAQDFSRRHRGSSHCDVDPYRAKTLLYVLALFL
jgi:hypothetical protein